MANQTMAKKKPIFELGNKVQITNYILPMTDLVFILMFRPNCNPEKTVQPR